MTVTQSITLSAATSGAVLGSKSRATASYTIATGGAYTAGLAGVITALPPVTVEFGPGQTIAATFTSAYIINTGTAETVTYTFSSGTIFTYS